MSEKKIEKEGTHLPGALGKAHLPEAGPARLERPCRLPRARAHSCVPGMPWTPWPPRPPPASLPPLTGTPWQRWRARTPFPPLLIRRLPLSRKVPRKPESSTSPPLCPHAATVLLTPPHLVQETPRRRLRLHEQAIEPSCTKDDASFTDPSPAAASSVDKFPDVRLPQPP